MSSTSIPPTEEEGGRKRHAVPPPGFESLFAQNFPADCKSPFAALVIAVHWSTVHTTNLRLTDDSTKRPTECLPAGWPSKIAIYGDASSRFIPLEYKNPETGRAVTVKVQELSVNGVAAVMSEEQNPEKNGKVHATTLETEVYVNCSAVQDGERNVYTLYKVDKLWELCETVKTSLLEEEADARKGDEATKSSSPYSSNLSKEQEAALKRDRDQRELERLRAEYEEFYDDPLRASRPGPGPLPPNRGIGRSDLDPFSGIGGAGGMLMDPRGFRRPQMPGGVPPGARFDPFGPMGPGGGFGGGGGFGPLGPGRGGNTGGRGAPGIPFGYINPDHEQAHGYDDMFS